MRLFRMQTFLKKIYIFLVALFALFSATAAEEVSFTLNAPMIVSEGETFRIEFELNAKPDDNSFVPPSFEGFDVVAGPSVSQGSSVQIINGEITKSVSYAITYVLVPQSVGNTTIGAATISVKKRSYATQPTIVEVRKGEQGGASQQGRGGQNESLESRANRTVGKEDLLLRLELSKRSVYRGEPVRAILKLYSRVNIAGSEGAKMPAFNGFWSQQVDIEQGPFRETLNGKVYEAYNIAEYLLYPQQGGTLTIEPAEMTVVVQVMVQSNRGFDPFFGGHEVYNVRRALKTPEVKVQVKEFPVGAPASFAGAVGRYTMSHKLSASEVTANSALSLQLTISGTGNLNFVKAPELSLPSSFELYDIKTEEKISTSASGSVGYRRFDYPIIVRAEGSYDIAPVAFTYFDTEKAKYVTLTTPQLHISVTPDKNATTQPSVALGVKREDVRLLGEDIRFIMLGAPALRSYIAPFILSPLYWVVLVALVALAVVAYIVIRKRIRDSRNMVLIKGRRANKMAIRRLRIAEKYMREQDRRAFYEEMLRALWGYLSDRFNIPVADLTKEGVREELSRRGAEAEAEDIISIITRCEEAQYSPMATVDMGEVYTDGIDVVSKIETALKR